MLRIAIVEHNKLNVKERGMCWRAIAKFVDDVNEKRFSVNDKMESKQIMNFEKLEPIALVRT